MMPSFGSLLAALIAALLAAALTSAHVANIRQSTPTFNGQDGNFAATMDPCSTGGSQQSWPDHTIPYAISSSVPASLRLTIQQVIRSLELAATCIYLVPRTSQQDYVLFEHGKSCCSHQGRAGVGMQLVFLHESCEEIGLLGTIARLTGEDYSIDSDEQVVFTNLKQKCQDACGSVLDLSTGSHGMVQSPGFPGAYPANRDCSWKFWIPTGFDFSVKFLNFDLEDDHLCSFDYVELIDQTDEGIVISSERACGERLPFNYSSSGRVVSIRLHTDSDIQENGFKAEYSMWDGNLVTGRGYPVNECLVNNGGCEQICEENGVGQHIGCACHQGYQLATDGHSCTDVDECAQHNGGCNHRCKNTDGSFYCHCKLGYGLGPGLKTCISCGGTLNGTSGNIYSPAFPSPYPAYQNCQWELERQPGTYLRLTLTNMDIRPTHKCTEDYLKPSTGNFKNSRRLCGYYSQIQYLVKSEDDVSLRFRTKGVSGLDKATGFQLHYEQVPVAEVSESELDFAFINGISVNYYSKNWLA